MWEVHAIVRFLVTSLRGRAVAQAISGWLPTAAARIRALGEDM
jgi:hypothetical protein